MNATDTFQSKFEAAQVSKIKRLENRVEIIRLILDISGAKIQGGSSAVYLSAPPKR